MGLDSHVICRNFASKDSKHVVETHGLFQQKHTSSFAQTGCSLGASLLLDIIMHPSEGFLLPYANPFPCVCLPVCCKSFIFALFKGLRGRLVSMRRVAEAGSCTD